MPAPDTGPPSPHQDVATSALLAGALLVTVGITSGVAALFGSRPVDPSALLSAEHTPLVITATRLTAAATATSAANLTPRQPKSECQFIAC